jgi:hypothetical protein
LDAAAWVSQHRGQEEISVTEVLQTGGSTWDANGRFGAPLENSALQR